MDLACIAQKLSGVFFRESHRAPGCPKPSRHRDRSAPPSRKQNVIGDSSQSRAHLSPPEVSAQCQWSHHAQGPWTQPPASAEAPAHEGREAQWRLRSHRASARLHRRNWAICCPLEVLEQCCQVTQVCTGPAVGSAASQGHRSSALPTPAGGPEVSITQHWQAREACAPQPQAGQARRLHWPG